MSEPDARMTILEMIESGKISAEEGLRLLQAISGQVEESEAELPPTTANNETEQVEDEAEESAAEPEETEEPEVTAGPGASAIPPEMERWRHFWMIPLWIGVGVTVISGLLMYSALQNSGLGFWFACATTPFVLGVFMMALAWGSRKARWLHLRVQQKPGESPQRVSLSFPIPLRFSAWFLRTFRHRIPELDKNLREKSIDEILLALERTTNPQNPLFVQVDEGDDGEKVTIYIG